MSDIIAYLGPAGTFCEEAALLYRGNENCRMSACRSIRDVFKFVEQQQSEIGLVPIENSYEGAVNQTLDLIMVNNEVKLAGEVVIEIKHNLLTSAGVCRNEITAILSHGQALAQCQEYLNENYPGVELLEVPSTAEAARLVATSGKTWAAIANQAAARNYGLEIMETGIQDQPNNSTRFVVLRREDCELSPNCKTSLLVYVPDRPGALYEVLREFYIRNINLCKIESRPARTRIGEYLFFIDIEGHRLETSVKEVLTALPEVSEGVRVLGSYPKAR